MTSSQLSVAFGYDDEYDDNDASSSSLYLDDGAGIDASHSDELMSVGKAMAQSRADADATRDYAQTGPRLGNGSSTFYNQRIDQTFRAATGPPIAPIPVVSPQSIPASPPSIPPLPPPPAVYNYDDDSDDGEDEDIFDLDQHEALQYVAQKQEALETMQNEQAYKFAALVAGHAAKDVATLLETSLYETARLPQPRTTNTSSIQEYRKRKATSPQQQRSNKPSWTSTMSNIGGGIGAASSSSFATLAPATRTTGRQQRQRDDGLAQLKRFDRFDRAVRVASDFTITGKVALKPILRSAMTSTAALFRDNAVDIEDMINSTTYSEAVASRLAQMTALYLTRSAGLSGNRFTEKHVQERLTIDIIAQEQFLIGHVTFGQAERRFYLDTTPSTRGYRFGRVVPAFPFRATGQNAYLPYSNRRTAMDRLIFG